MRTRSAGGEAARRSLVGAVLAALPVTAALPWDIRLPFTDYLLSSADLRTDG
ncbi:hypothetical protein GCM10010269_12190 [Streptomyces humidus]|uniref:Uncharacterized protein n=1 Tax=Streptomyces humidus TaxID=52259 RepID=A0A918FRX6_9ACTN|nr:hypothetical protein [Streptomyces humidus]GGR74669.1 hypothetical protein GCM10010269_12190 [Streptomyces humidus]